MIQKFDFRYGAQHFLSFDGFKEPVGEHFNVDGHKWNEMMVLVIDHNQAGLDRCREKRKQGKVFKAWIEIIPP